MKILIQVKVSLFLVSVPVVSPFPLVCLLEWGILHRQGLSPFSSGHSPPLLCQQVLLGVSCTGSCVIETGGRSASQIELGICFFFDGSWRVLCAPRGDLTTASWQWFGAFSLCSSHSTHLVDWQRMAFKLCLEFGFNPPQSSVKPGRNLFDQWVVPGHGFCHQPTSNLSELVNPTLCLS